MNERQWKPDEWSVVWAKPGTIKYKAAHGTLSWVGDPKANLQKFTDFGLDLNWNAYQRRLAELDYYYHAVVAEVDVVHPASGEVLLERGQKLDMDSDRGKMTLAVCREFPAYYSVTWDDDLSCYHIN